MASWEGDADQCPTCGWHGPQRCLCVAVLGSPAERAALLAAAQAGDREAVRLCGHIRDESSREALEAVAATARDRALVEAAWSALANIASEASMPAATAQLDGAWGRQLHHLTRYLVRVGAPGAAEVLAGLADRSLLAAEGLAALGDQRGVDALLAAAVPGDQRAAEAALHALAQLPPGPWSDRLLEVLGAVAALVTVPGDAAELDVRRHLVRVAALVRQRCGEVGAAAVDQASARTGVDLAVLAPDGTPPDEDPEGATVPAWALDYDLGDAAHPGTRFGGQPTWLDRPTWPLTSAGTPMAFWAQIRLPAGSGDGEAMAYLFVDHHDDIISSEGGSPSLFVQPGGVPAGAWVPDATGPTLPDSSWRDRSFRPPWPWGMAARVPSLRPFHEPARWDHGAGPVPDRSWDKVGGTPVFLQGAPRIEGQEFLCQFTAEQAGHELGDGAQCYLFVDRAAGTGTFHWDCH